MFRASFLPLLFSASFAMTAWAQTPAPFSHDLWQEVLAGFVDASGRVDYQALAENRESLDRYVDSIRGASPENRPALFPTRDHELAYYLNAYNALVFVGVLELGPGTPTVWGKSGLGVGFFVRRKYEIGGRRLSLKKLEDDVIRKGFRDPRIHAALNCASLDCPRLGQEPFRGESLPAQLDAAMDEWLADPNTVRVDEERRTVVLSKIFDWFRRDFLEAQKGEGGGARPKLIGFINRYRREEEQIPLSFREEFRSYDKRLNGRS